MALESQGTTRSLLASESAPHASCRPPASGSEVPSLRLVEEINLKPRIETMS